MTKTLWGFIRDAITAYKLEKKTASEVKPGTPQGVSCIEYDTRFDILTEDGRRYSFQKEASTSDADKYF